MSSFKFYKIKEFFLKNEEKLVLFVGFSLISVISFQFGIMKGKKMHQEPFIIEKGIEDQNTAQKPVDAILEPRANDYSIKGTELKTKNSCAFVGSKNSDKFYAPTCQWAKRIKTENKVCYENEQEAIAKGKIKSDCK